MADRFEHRDIAFWRMRGQGLSDPRFSSPADVAGWLGAVQSQDPVAAPWSIGMRCGMDAAAVERALAHGEILRTHVLRPTWHYVLPADIRWMLELTADRVRAAMASANRRLGLDERVLGRAGEVIARAVEAGPRTRSELAEALVAAGIAVKPPANRLAHIVMDAELEGLVCSGPPRGRQQTYVPLATRAPGASRLPRDVALAVLAQRYFTSHGPATEKDFRWWSGLRAADARAGMAALGTALGSLEVDGRTLRYVGDRPSARGPAPTGVLLLQGFDEYIVAYTESRDVLDVDGLASNLYPARPPFVHAVLLGGQVIGHWRRRTGSGTLSIEARLARTLQKNERRALEEAAAAYGAFHGVEAELRLGP